MINDIKIWSARAGANAAPAPALTPASAPG